MSEEGQAMCFFAGANSIFYGDKLLTAQNPAIQQDLDLIAKLGLDTQAPDPSMSAPEADCSKALSPDPNASSECDDTVCQPCCSE